VITIDITITDDDSDENVSIGFAVASPDRVRAAVARAANAACLAGGYETLQEQATRVAPLVFPPSEVQRRASRLAAAIDSKFPEELDKARTAHRLGQLANRNRVATRTEFGPTMTPGAIETLDTALEALGDLLGTLKRINPESSTADGLTTIPVTEEVTFTTHGAASFIGKDES
jgi:hypothetical protein